MLMNNYSTSYYKLPWKRVCLFCLLLTITFYVTSISCRESQVSYTDHCASFVPESIPHGTWLCRRSLPLPVDQDGYCTYDHGVFITITRVRTRQIRQKVCHLSSMIRCMKPILKVFSWLVVVC